MREIRGGNFFSFVFFDLFLLIAPAAGWAAVVVAAVAAAVVRTVVMLLLLQQFLASLLSSHFTWNKKKITQCSRIFITGDQIVSSSYDSTVKVMKKTIS